MLKVHKYLLICFFCALLSISYSSLGSANSSTPASSIDFWLIEDELTDDTLLTLIDEFEIEYSISVNLQYYSKDAAKEAYKAAFFDDTAPDLIEGDAGWIPELVTNDMLSVVNKSNFPVEFMPEALRSVSYFTIEDDILLTDKLSYYGYPFSFDIQAFVYNKARATTASIPSVDGAWTMAEFKTAVSKLNDQTNPLNKKYGISYSTFPDNVEPMFYGMGGVKFSNLTCDRENIQIKSANSIAALQYIHDFTTTNKITPSFAAMTPEATYESFANLGNVSSTFAFSYEIKRILEGTQYTSTPSNLGIGPYPMNEGKSGDALRMRSLMFSTQSTAGEREAAELLAQFLTSSDALVRNAAGNYFLPPCESCYTDSRIKDNAIIEAYHTLIPYLTIEPISKFWPSLQSEMKIEIEEILSIPQTGTLAATAIFLRWSFILPAKAGIPPIPDPRPTPKKKVAGYWTFGLSVIFVVSTILVIKISKVKKHA